MDNTTNCTIRHSETAANRSAGLALLMSHSRRQDLFGAKFWAGSATPVTAIQLRVKQPKRHSVSRVFACSNVLQVVPAVIQLVSVFVVDLITFWAWTQKRECHQSVNGKRFPIAMSAAQRQIDLIVRAAPVKPWFEYNDSG